MKKKGSRRSVARRIPHPLLAREGWCTASVLYASEIKSLGQPATLKSHHSKNEGWGPRQLVLIARTGRCSRTLRNQRRTVAEPCKGLSYQTKSLVPLLVDALLQCASPSALPEN